jgi:hypothetical protein
MKSSLFFLAVAAILAAPSLAGCDIITGADTGTPVVDDARQGMTQEAIRMWEERGVANVDTIERASALAGFKAEIPGYIPDGFSRQNNIMVTRLGGGLPEGMKPAFSAIIVETFYFLEGDDTVMFSIQQSNGKASIAGGQPAEICGQEGEKQYLPADPRRKYPSEILTLTVRKGGYSFSIYATLAGHLDEVAIEKILCSVSAD